MKTRISQNGTKFYIIILLTLFNIASAEGSENNPGSDFNSVPPHEIPNVLTLILDKTKSNYDSIQTWQGMVDFTVDIIYKGPAAERVFNENTDGNGDIPKIVMKHKEGNIQFAVDAEKGLVYENLSRPEPVQYIDLETGRNLIAKTSLPWYTISIITPEHFTQSFPVRYSGNSIVSRMATKEEPNDCPTCIMSGVFDPRSHLGSKKLVEQTLSFIIQKIQEDGKFTVGEYDLELEKHQREGNTQYRILIPLKNPETYGFATMVFSVEKGYNITLYEITIQNQLLQKISWVYSLVDGIYLPTKTEKQNFNQQTGELNYREEFIFKNSLINLPIPEDTFTYKNLVLKDDDKFIDKILDKEYIYKNEELIPVTKE